MKKLLLIFILLPILGFAQGFQTKTDTIHFLNQNKVIALQDSLNKKIAWTDTGTTANKIIKLDGAAKLPAVDGSQLTGISAGATILMAVKTVDETVNNSVTYQNDDHLTVTVAANTTYILELVMLISQSSTGVGVIAQFTAPLGGTVHSNVFRNAATNSAIYLYGRHNSLSINDEAGVAAGVGNYNIIKSNGVFFNGANGGSLTVQWAQHTLTVADTNVLKGSYLKLTKVQ